jgi:3-phenylpropionate/trans-cinnamate dioxygenase ferredoxin subunit
MWHKVAKITDLKEGTGRQVEAGSKVVALFLFQGQYYALRDQCTHAGAPLHDGVVRDFCVRCAAHGAEFDIRNGLGVGELAYNNVRAYKTRVIGDDVEVEI